MVNGVNAQSFKGVGRANRSHDTQGGLVMNSGKAIFVGNIKGGVGKSTLAVYLTDYLRHRDQRRPVMLLDTDPQGTAFEMMQPCHLKNQHEIM